MYGNYSFNFENIDKVLDSYDKTDFLAIRFEEVENENVCAVGYINDNGKINRVELSNACPNMMYQADTIPMLLKVNMKDIESDFDIFKYSFISKYRQLNMKYLKTISYKVIPDTSNDNKNDIVQIYAEFDNGVSMFLMECKLKEFINKLYFRINKFTSKHNIHFEEHFDEKIDIRQLANKEKDISLNLNQN